MAKGSAYRLSELQLQQSADLAFAQKENIERTVGAG
jgi:hypothetical protein